MTEGRRVADLAQWSLTELHPLHQELDKGTIRVNPRIQEQQIPQQQMSKPSRRSGDTYLQRQLIGRLKSQLGTYTTHSARKVTGAYFYICGSVPIHEIQRPCPCCGGNHLSNNADISAISIKARNPMRQLFCNPRYPSYVGYPSYVAGCKI